MEMSYRKKVEKAANVLHSMKVYVNVCFFRFADTVSWETPTENLDVVEVRPLGVMIRAKERDYCVPFYMMSEDFYSRLWGVYEKVIKNALTETGWEVFKIKLNTED